MFAFGKIHSSFFDSSINDSDPITRFVFIATIVLSDRDGRLDVTRQSLARRINLPIEDIDRAIATLSAPDPLSRSKDHEGRRLIPIDDDRPWGWIVVNKGEYRDMAARAEQTDGSRLRKQRQRRRQCHAKVTPRHGASRVSRHTDTDKDPDTDTKIGGVSLDELFDERWNRYPKKDGRKAARRHFAASVRTPDDLRNFDRALNNYIAKIGAERIEPRYIKNGGTFFGNWTDFTDWQPVAAQNIVFVVPREE